jgi:HD-like signal output (HDOD) protein
VPAPVSAPPFAPAPAPDEIVRQLRHLPSAPRVLPRLKQLLSDGNSSMHEVVAMIRLDPGIAARVLQMGNSAYYSQGLRCYTVDEAVNRVGYDQIYELVATAVASQVLVRPLAVYGLEADDLWRMSVACALGAELLADHLGTDRDVAYTVGLLHGLGLVAIDEWAFRHQLGLCFTKREWPLESCEAERVTLGFHNAEVGAALLRLWDFPPVMSEPVRWQYLPRGTAAHFQYAALLHVAKWLRTAVCGRGAEPALPEATLLRTLNLPSRHLTSLAEQVRSKLQQVHSLLDIATPERATLLFPNGERSISGHLPTRSFINRYA